MAGISLSYSAQINLGTPHLRTLRIPEALVSLVWLAGPLSGLIMQPIVGLYSDSCTSRFGRRRPFILIGAILTALSLLLFSLSRPLCALFFESEKDEQIARAISILAFFLLDFSIQAVQAPLRALVTDILPPAQLSRGNLCIAFYTGLGNLLGGILASLPLATFFPIFPTDLIAVFFITSVLLLITVAITCSTTPEAPLHNGRAHAATLSLPAAAPGNHLASPRERVKDALLHIPQPFWQVFAVQLCTWCGFFTLFVYLNSWVGTNIFMGDTEVTATDAQKALYHRGVRFGGRANAITAVVTLTYSAVLPRLLDIFGVVPIYFFSQLVEAVCLLSAPFIHGKVGQSKPSMLLKAITMLDVGAFGIVWATTMGVPWTLIGNALESDPRYAQSLGFFTTLFNASQSFPQLVVACVAPLVLILAKDPSAVMFLGGVCAFVGAVLVVTLPIDPNRRKRRGDKSVPRDDEKSGSGERKTARSQRHLAGVA